MVYVNVNRQDSARCRTTAISGCRQDTRRGVDAQPSVRQARPHRAHRAARRTARRQMLARAWLLIMRAVTAAAFAAAIGFAVVVLVHPAGADSRSFVSSTPLPRPGSDIPVSWVEQVAAEVLPSVVMLQISEGGKSELGSGIIVTPDGLIMTNYHVVAAVDARASDAGRTLVTLHDGHTAAFTVIAADPQSDIAVIRAQQISGLRPISIGSSAKLRVGEPVAAVGSPLGLDGTVTAGVVSAVNRLVCTNSDANNGSASFEAIQTDAAINPGNSGGPLVDSNGELVGVNSAVTVLPGSDGSGGIQHGSIGLGFAIPGDRAVRIAHELITIGRASHAWLGAQISRDTALHGAKLTGVTGGSPAAAAGLTVGALVTKIDDGVIPSGDALLAVVQSKDPGDAVTMEFVDAFGHQRTAKVRLGTDQG